MNYRLAILLLALATSAALAPSRIAAQTAGGDWDAEDRAVIAAVLNRAMGDRPTIVVADSTFVWPGDEGWRSYIHRWVQVNEASLREALADYAARNQRGYAVPADLPTRRPVRIFPQQEFRSLSGDRFARLQAVIPGTSSYHWVSRPGYDAARGIAVMYAVMNCEGLCGTGSVVVLRRTPEGWVVQGVAVMVVS